MTRTGHSGAGGLHVAAIANLKANFTKTFKKAGSKESPSKTGSVVATHIPGHVAAAAPASPKSSPKLGGGSESKLPLGVRSYGLSDSIDLTKKHMRDHAQHAAEPFAHAHHLSSESLHNLDLNGGFDALFRIQPRPGANRGAYRRVTFADPMETSVETYSCSEYDRRRSPPQPGDAPVMQDICKIRDELDDFKEFEMIVHEDSKSNTLIYRYNYERRMVYERSKREFIAKQHAEAMMQRLLMQRRMDNLGDAAAISAFADHRLVAYMEKLSMHRTAAIPVVHCLSADDVITTTPFAIDML